MIRLVTQCAVLLVALVSLPAITRFSLDAMFGNPAPMAGRAGSSSTETASVDDATVPPEPEFKPVTEYGRTIEQPLFFEGRRYPERVKAPTQAVAAAPKPVLSASQLKLVGILLSTESTRALVELASHTAVWVRVGEKVDAWTVDAIENNRVLLKSGTATAVLDLYPAGSVAGGGGTPPAPSVPQKASATPEQARPSPAPTRSQRGR